MIARDLAAVCVFCAGWELPRNCGHGQENGQWMPDGWFTRWYTARLEVGARVWRGLVAESGRDRVEAIRLRYR